MDKSAESHRRKTQRMKHREGENGRPLRGESIPGRWKQKGSTNYCSAGKAQTSGNGGNNNPKLLMIKASGDCRHQESQEGRVKVTWGSFSA